MNRILIFIPLFVVVLTFAVGLTKINQQTKKDDYWLRKCDVQYDHCGYVDRSGKTRIHKGKYAFCYTDTFRTLALVYDTSAGCIGINRNCEKLFNVFWFDNGPDYVSEGLFRIADNRNAFTQKVGFANLKGEIVIPIKFDFAEPFSEGFSAFCVGDTLKWDKYREHIEIHGGKWGYINKKGQVVIAPQYKWANNFQNDTAWVKTDSANYCIDKTGKILKKW